MTQESYINKAIKDIKSLPEVLAVNSMIRVI